MWYFVAGLFTLVCLTISCFFWIFSSTTAENKNKPLSVLRVSVEPQLTRYWLLGLLITVVVCFLGIVCLFPLGQVTTVLAVIPDVKNDNIKSLKFGIIELVEKFEHSQDGLLQFDVLPLPVNNNTTRVSVLYSVRTSILTKSRVMREIGMLKRLLEQKMDALRLDHVGDRADFQRKD